MKRAKAYLNLTKANTGKVREKAASIVVKMTGNTTFTTPSPTLASITTQADLVKIKQAEQDAAFTTYKQKTKEVDIEKDNLLNLLDTEASYVENIANGDETKIMSAGFDVRKASTPVGEVDAPKGLLATEGKKTGEILCTWKTVKGAKSYNVEHNADITNAETWKFAMSVTKATCTLTDLESGSRIWVRVLALGAAGEGPWSDVATKIVP
jgi:hypothetical protein